MTNNNLCNKPYTKGIPFKNIPEPGKLIQVPVVIGFGETEELVVSELTISPPNPPIFRIINVDKVVTITNFKLCSISDHEDDKSFKAKVIIDGFIDKNVLYKTITNTTPTSVGGPVFQFTTRIDFATFVVVKAKQPILDTDNVEILSAFVECEKEELLDPNCLPPNAPDFAVTFDTLLEKMIVKINLKITRTEHVCID